MEMFHLFHSLSWGVELEVHGQAEVSSSFFQENLRPRASKIHYIRKENQGALLMHPKIVIKYKNGVNTHVTCATTGEGPWTKEEIGGMIKWLNKQWDVHKAYAVGIDL